MCMNITRSINLGGVNLRLTFSLDSFPCYPWGMSYDMTYFLCYQHGSHGKPNTWYHNSVVQGIYSSQKQGNTNVKMARLIFLQEYYKPGRR